MSLLYGVIDTRQKLLTYSNAGHPSPVLMRDGGPIMLDSHGMLLGVVADATYGASVMPISSGDTLIAFTDGVSEAMNGKRKMFRSDGIIEVLQANPGASPQVILEAIWSQLESHLDGTRRARRPFPDGHPRPIRGRGPKISISATACGCSDGEAVGLARRYEPVL